MTGIWQVTFWRATFERVLSTALQTAIPSITLGSLNQVDWGQVLVIIGTAALLALVKAVLAGLSTGSPGFGTAEVLSEPGQTGTSSDAGPVAVVQDDGLTHPAGLSQLDRLDGLGRSQDGP